MTFHEAQIHCSKLNSTICEFQQNFVCALDNMYWKKNLVSPLNNAEIEELLKEKNIMEKQYIIWTDFERINMTHFRISISCTESEQKAQGYKLELKWLNSLTSLLHLGCPRDLTKASQKITVLS